MILYALFSVIPAAIIGFMGAKRRLGFWGYFFASLLLTPLIGLLLVFVTDVKKKK